MIYVEMKLEDWKVEPLSWTEFKAALLTQQAILGDSSTTMTPVFSKLCSVDLIIGGIDLTMDFRYVNSF
jgi:hypothetical protein